MAFFGKDESSFGKRKKSPKKSPKKGGKRKLNPALADWMKAVNKARKEMYSEYPQLKGELFLVNGESIEGRELYLLARSYYNDMGYNSKLKPAKGTKISRKRNGILKSLK